MRIRQFNHCSKRHIDAAFAKTRPKPDLTESHTPEDIQHEYGITRITIRSHTYRPPSKKELGQICYPKLHFDLSKTSEQECKAEYHTVYSMSAGISGSHNHLPVQKSPTEIFLGLSLIVWGE